MSCESSARRVDASSTALAVVAGCDLSGKEAIVTGGAGGLGRETVLALASAGARVVLTGRDRERGPALAEQLQHQAGNGPVVYRHLDLASQRSVTTWTRRHADTGKPCHILINNAAVMATPFGRTEDGFETQFGTNHLGHFAFTIGLLPNLRRAEAARVISVTSSAHRRSDINYADPNYHRRPYDPWQAYGQSKTANALFAVAFTARHASEGITANAVMPGAIVTGLQRHMSPDDRAARGWPAGANTKPVPGWKTPAQGAATSVWAATATELDGLSGKYLEDCAIAQAWTQDGPPPAGTYLPYALNEQNAERLWSLSHDLLLGDDRTPSR